MPVNHARPKRLGEESFTTTTVDGELLVYDPERQHIHHLNPVASTVWHLCDGQRTVPAIAAAATSELGEPVDDEHVRLALELLENASLIDAGGLVPARRSRRSFLRKAAIGGVAVPLIASVTAPDAALASSNCADRNYGDCSVSRCCESPSTCIEVDAAYWQCQP